MKHSLRFCHAAVVAALLVGVAADAHAAAILFVSNFENNTITSYNATRGGTLASAVTAGGEAAGFQWPASYARRRISGHRPVHQQRPGVWSRWISDPGVRPGQRRRCQLALPIRRQTERDRQRPSDSTFTERRPSRS